MYYVLIAIHIVVCFALIGIVLLQSGKAADLAGAFGGMGSQTAFGPRGAATVLSKATTVAAVVFMLTSIALSIYATRRGGGTRSVLQGSRAPAQQQVPAKPAQVPPAPLAPGQPVNIQVTPQPAEQKDQAPAAPAQQQQQQPAPAQKK